VQAESWRISQPARFDTWRTVHNIPPAGHDQPQPDDGAAKADFRGTLLNFRKLLEHRFGR
jgi:hypothetical protein